MEVYARVADRRGDPLTGLTGADFEVRENGETQAIASFSEGQFPLAVAVALDRSFSMSGGRLALPLGVARTLLGELRSEDESMVVAIGSEVDVVAPLSTDRRVQLAALGRLDAFGTTGLCRQIQQSDASDAC